MLHIFNVASKRRKPSTTCPVLSLDLSRTLTFSLISLLVVPVIMSAPKKSSSEAEMPKEPRPELGSITDTDAGHSTAEIAANAPRYRRKSSTFIDGIHDVPEEQDMAPAQLYSTMSGRLFHSGRIAIVMVGLPARGKT